MPKNNPAVNVGLATPKVKGSYFRRDMDVLTTLPPYKYVPIGWMDVPGRTHVDMSPIINIDSLPAVSPLYDGWTLDTYYYFVPFRLFMKTLRRNNVEDVGNFDELKFPYLRYGTAYVNSEATTPSLYRSAGTLLAGSVMQRLGFQPANMRTLKTYNNQSVINTAVNLYSQTDFNLIPLLSYVSTWLYGQFNKQDKNIPVECLNVGYGTGRTQKRFYVDYDDLKQVELYFGYGVEPDWNGLVGSLNADMDSISLSPFTYGTSSSSTFQGALAGGDDVNSDTLRVCLVPNYPIFDVQFENFGILNNAQNLRNEVSNTGLLPVTHYGDYFTSWFNEESIQKLEEYAVEVNESLLSIRKKNADFLIDMLAMVSGNDYRSFLKYVYGAELDLVDHPIMVGKDTISFGFTEVLNQSANTDPLNTTDVSQSLAYSASKARSKRNQVRDINFKTREPGLLLVCASLRSTCRYFEGQDAFLYKTEYSEIWHPQYSATGFDQPRKGEIYANLVGNLHNSSDIGSYFPASGVNEDDFSLPYVPVGYEYMTGKRTLSGAMVTDYYRTWSLARDWRGYRFREINDVQNEYLTDVPSVEELSTTYGVPEMFNYNFVDTSFGAQNFIVDFTARVNCYQPMKKVLVKPTL